MWRRSCRKTSTLAVVLQPVTARRHMSQVDITRSAWLWLVVDISTGCDPGQHVLNSQNMKWISLACRTSVRVTQLSWFAGTFCLEWVKHPFAKGRIVWNTLDYFSNWTSVVKDEGVWTNTSMHESLNWYLFPQFASFFLFWRFLHVNLHVL